MKIIIKLFASHREFAGESELALEFAGKDEIEVSEVIEDLFKRYPEMEKLRDETIVSINKTFAEKDDKIRDGDEVAVFPPVSGG